MGDLYIPILDEHNLRYTDTNIGIEVHDGMRLVGWICTSLNGTYVSTMSTKIANLNKQPMVKTVDAAAAQLLSNYLKYGFR